MKGKIEEIKEQLGDQRYEASVGGGMVRAIVTGRLEVESIRIEPEVMDDADMLQTMVCAAVNEAIRKAQDALKERIAELTGGLNLPGLT